MFKMLWMSATNFDHVMTSIVVNKSHHGKPLGNADFFPWISTPAAQCSQAGEETIRQFLDETLVLRTNSMNVEMNSASPSRTIAGVLLFWQSFAIAVCWQNKILVTRLSARQSRALVIQPTQSYTRTANRTKMHPLVPAIIACGILDFTVVENVTRNILFSWKRMTSQNNGGRC